MAFDIQPPKKIKNLPPKPQPRPAIQAQVKPAPPQPKPQVKAQPPKPVKVKKPKPVKKPRSFKWLKVLTTLIILASLAAAGWYFWQQYQQAPEPETGAQPGVIKSFQSNVRNTPSQPSTNEPASQPPLVEVNQNYSNTLDEQASQEVIVPDFDTSEWQEIDNYLNDY